MAIDKLIIQTKQNVHTLILCEHSKFIVTGLMQDVYCISQRPGSIEFPLNTNVGGLKHFLYYNFVLVDL